MGCVVAYMTFCVDFCPPIYVTGCPCVMSFNTIGFEWHKRSIPFFVQTELPTIRVSESGDAIHTLIDPQKYPYLSNSKQKTRVQEIEQHFELYEN